MTEKVVLTKEQAEAIEEFQKTVHELGISLDELKVIFESGYEVKPEFKVGDWFVYIGKDGEVAEYIKKGFTGQVEAVHYGFITDGYHRFYNSEIRHATPGEISKEEERQFFAEHGRKVWELKKYDRIKCKSTDKEYEILDVEKPLRFKVLDMRDVHLRILEFYNTQQISSRFVVVCFAENRLDVKTND